MLVPIDDSLALDAKLAFKVSDAVTIAIAGENLTDAAGVGLSPIPAERRLRASVQIRY
jgi:iron complex outermembrane receptor protein